MECFCGALVMVDCVQEAAKLLFRRGGGEFILEFELNFVVDAHFEIGSKLL